ncbi:hypothetical protein B0H14DRAFT_2621476 [Mycena olivaceomarginata]|nr:hypothetical protein B0H14DRAFT_2621476 [Mycena olivaceomarginata]
MSPSPAQRCVNDEDRHTRRLGSYRKYRRAHLEERREKTRLRMAALRAAETKEQQEVRRERNCQAQRRYRERFREAIAHRAQRALLKKNAEQGRQPSYALRRDITTQRRSLSPRNQSQRMVVIGDSLAFAFCVGVAASVYRAFLAPSSPPIPIRVMAWPQPQPAPSQPLPHVGPTPQPPETGGAAVIVPSYAPSCAEKALIESKKIGVRGYFLAILFVPPKSVCNCLGFVLVVPIWLTFFCLGSQDWPEHRREWKLSEFPKEIASTWCTHSFHQDTVDTSPHLMSSSKPTRTNLEPHDVVMDHRGDRDPRYWCLPPFRGDPTCAQPLSRSGYRYHLVWQGHTVGTFDTWAMAKTSLTGYPGSGKQGLSNRGGMHRCMASNVPAGGPPPSCGPSVPAQQCANAPMYTGPRKTTAQPSSCASVKPKPETPKRGAPAIPPASPHRHGARSRISPVNFAIRGCGSCFQQPVRLQSKNKIPRADPPPRARAQDLYEELQRHREEPEMLIIRSFQDTAFFALDKSVVGDAEGEDDGV